MLTKLASRARPPRLYYEAKANLTKEQLRLLARAGFWGIYLGIENLSTAVLHLMDKGTSSLLNIRALKWCVEVGLKPDWAFLCGFPGEEPAEYARLADLLLSLTHLPAPIGPYQIRVDRYSPYFVAPEAHGLQNVHANVAYQHVYPFPLHDLDRLAYYFDYEYADGRVPQEYTASLKQAIEDWRAHSSTARLELRDEGDYLEIEDTRPAAPRPRVLLEGPARLAYLALDAGASSATVCERLSESLGPASPSRSQIANWLDEWEGDRLVLREGARYLSLATNPAERIELPVDRFLAQLLGEPSGAQRP